jgi:hypothetical protein
MNREVLISFGDGNIATVHPSGIVDIRLVDDKNHHTMTGRMSINEFAYVAKKVFVNVRDAVLCKDDARAEASDIISSIACIEHVWEEESA